ncbi:MAM domain-containing glycosylphosphatidylinositol anchor protein 1-like [Ostrea edulis]|uniref:MAM domain-containing glycosylphosphatidylinositol anchor protein 1-like n=1 Tax=Ostrea edulis TaxID=37623 RepID=UPI0024AF58F7|nr:MAM domain-containing glycosylphosphatidylinositol anchor protein 1-like [Ostrea edulis]
MYLFGFIICFIKIASLANACLEFKFSREISASDSVQVISNYTGSSKEELFGLCVPRCSSDMACNAFDICVENLQCRTIRGWTPILPGNASAGLCQRHQMECDDGYYYNREKETCNSHEYCDFEDDPESSCFLSESTADEFDWTRQTGSTTSVATGPTSAASGQYYKYIETSAVVQHERAILETTKTFQDKTYCLTMYYHMYGDTTESLFIRTKKGNDAPITRWQKSGNQGNSWYQLSGVNLTLDSQTKILIEATKGSSYTGDIAIDYVELWPFACP